MSEPRTHENWRPRQSHTVVCVDDERPILDSITRLLRREPFEVVTTTRPSEALEMAERREVSVLVTDQRMPDMPGTELLKRVRQRTPSTGRILVTAFADVTAVTEALNEGGIRRVIYKPWNDDELRAAIRECVRERERGAPSGGLEELLKRQTWSLRLSQEMLDAIETPVAGISPADLSVLHCNVAFLRLLGARRAELTQGDTRRLLPPVVYERLKELRESTAEGEDIVALNGVRFRLRALRCGGTLLGLLVFVEGDLASVWRPAPSDPPGSVRLECHEMRGDDLLADLDPVLRGWSGRERSLEIVIGELPRLQDSVPRFLRGLLHRIRETDVNARIVERSGFLDLLLDKIGGAYPFVRRERR